PPGGEGQRPPVVAGRGGDDAHRPPGAVQRQQRIGRSPELEAAGRLLMLAFEPDGKTCPRTEARRLAQWRRLDAAGEAAARLEDLCERHHPEPLPDISAAATRLPGILAPKQQPYYGVGWDRRSFQSRWAAQPILLPPP